jgi:hypothetical protein
LACRLLLAVVRTKVSSTPSADSAAAAALYVAQNFFGLEQLDRVNRFRACRGNKQATGERRERGLMRYPRDEFSATER